jgi:hypothetical protein
MVAARDDATICDEAGASASPGLPRAFQPRVDVHRPEHRAEVREWGSTVRWMPCPHRLPGARRND